MIGEGDAVVLDIGGSRAGYCSDTSRTAFVGEPPADFLALYEVLREAQAAACDAVAPGVTAESVDRAAREVIEEAGYGERFIHRTGHGIGMETHEEPYIVTGNEEPLQIGHAFSIEPGIYIAGQWGARIEDIVVCTESRRREAEPLEPRAVPGQLTLRGVSPLLAPGAAPDASRPAPPAPGPRRRWPRGTRP